MSTPFENLHLRGIAHDFNNILGGIIGYAEMLVESTAEGSTHRRFAQNEPGITASPKKACRSETSPA
jgi:hypothetical protein